MVASILTVLLIFIHIVAIAVWIGGAIFMVFIVAPNLSVVSPPEAGKISQAIGEKFASIVMWAIALVALTGVLRMYTSGLLNITILTGTTYGKALLLKLLLFIVMLIVGSSITKTMKGLGPASSPEEAVAGKNKITQLSQLNIALGVLLIFLGVGLRYGIF